MYIRMLMWGITFGLAGAVIADYSSYDVSLATTILGAIVGAVLGAAIGMVIHRMKRS